MDDYEQDPQWRAEDAKRLREDPILNEAFSMFEKALLDRAIEAPLEDDEGRMRCMMAVQVLRQVRRHFDKIVFDGNKAAKVAEDVASGKSRWT